MNTIILIGNLGEYQCYLNLTKEEAFEKHFEKYPTDDLKYKNYLIATTREIEFENSFGIIGNLKPY